MPSPACQGKRQKLLCLKTLSCSPPEMQHVNKTRQQSYSKANSLLCNMHVPEGKTAVLPPFLDCHIQPLYGFTAALSIGKSADFGLVIPCKRLNAQSVSCLSRGLTANMLFLSSKNTHEKHSLVLISHSSFYFVFRPCVITLLSQM